MISSMETLNAITKIHDVEKNQIKETSGDYSSDNNALDKDTALNIKITKDNSYNAYDSKINNKFNEILSSVKNDDYKKSFVKDVRNEVKKVSTKTKDTKDKAVKETEDDLQEKIKKLNDDQILECLNLIAQLFNKSLEENQNLQALIGNQTENINDLLRNSLMDIINSNDELSALLSKNASTEDFMKNANDIFNNMLNALEAIDSNKKLDVNTLKLAQKLVSEVSERTNSSETLRTDDNAALTKLIASTENKINALLENTNKSSNELTLSNNSLNNIYKNVLNDSNNSSSNNDENSSKQNSETSSSKDEKVLQSILNGKDTNAVPVFNTNIVVNNAAGTITEVKQVVNASTMKTDIIQNVKFMATNDMREMVVKVNPGNLGEITIRLVEEDGMMKLHMKATSKETYSLLVQQSSDIKNQLSDQNIKIQDVNISLYEEDTTFFKDGKFNNSSNEDRKGHNGNKASKNDEGFGEAESEKEDLHDTSSVNMLV